MVLYDICEIVLLMGFYDIFVSSVAWCCMTCVLSVLHRIVLHDIYGDSVQVLV